jgi:hypothetical protein
MYSHLNNQNQVAPEQTNQPRDLSQHLNHDLAFHLVDQHSPKRSAHEAYIAQRFSQQYGATVRDFLPYFISLSNGQDLCASVGLQAAAKRALFLEQYLNMPVQQAISSVFLCPIDRAKIIEIGNLVATRSGSSYFLFAAMTQVLHEAGFQWLIFTATHQVKKIINKMGFNPIELCEADANKLSNKSNWGSYYENNPSVLAGNLNSAYTLLMNTPTLLELLAPHQKQLATMAAVLAETQYV